MELMALGSLFDVLHNELIPDIPWGLRVKILRQASKGMYFLHSSGIVHRDLKSLNLLLDNKWNVKVSDFGLTRFRDQLKRQQQSQDDAVMGGGGSIPWSAPEVLGEKGMINWEAADMYSFGIILWEVVTREEPYPGRRFSSFLSLLSSTHTDHSLVFFEVFSSAAIAVAVLRDDLRPTIPTNAPQDFIALISEAWHIDPSMRPTFLEAMTRLSAIDEESSALGTSWQSSSTGGGAKTHSARHSVCSSGE